MRYAHALCVVVAALLLTGCAMPSTTDRHREIPTDTTAQDDLIASAHHTLLTRCLARRGLRLPDTPARSKATAPAEKRLQAALFGTDPRELSLTLPTGYTVTTNTDGCLASAQRALYGDHKRWFRAEAVVNNLRAEARARLKATPEHRAALAKWGRCARPSGASPSRRPAAAVTDHCDRESGLARITARLEPPLLAEVRERRRPQLTTYQRLRAKALRRAVRMTTQPHRENRPYNRSERP